MATDNIISRADADALIPLPVTQALIARATEQSAAMANFRTVQMATKQERMPVLSALPLAYFVNGDTGLKQTTEINWKSKDLIAEEIAVIVPIPDSVAADAAYNIWDQSMPLLAEAVGRALDAAVFFGVNKPASWPAAIATAAAAAGNTVTRSATAANGGIASDISDTFAKVEADGFDVNAIVTNRGYRGLLRNARTTFGTQLLDSTTGIYDTPVIYSMNGLWTASTGNPELFALDKDQFVLGIRQDMTFKIFTEGVIQDNTGAIVYNLLQQDMSAMRLVFRVAWQVSNQVTTSQAVEASRYPAAVLLAP